MKFNLTETLKVVAVLVALSSPATATISFNFFGPGSSPDSGFLGESGQLEGITYGLIFDTGADGFDSAYTGLFISTGEFMGGSDDDVFVYGGTTVSSFGGGLIPDVNSVSDTYAGDSFRVIWFQSSLSSGGTATAGNTYGLSSIETAPSVGNTNPYDMTLAAGVVNAGSLTFVPEPSAFLLTALGGLMLLRRRRND